jgi:hypothetical protein
LSRANYSFFNFSQWWAPRGGTQITKEWTEYNNNGVTNTDSNQRKLGGPVSDYPKDFKLEIAVNGKIIRVWTYDEFKAMIGEVAYNQAFFPLVDDDTLPVGNVELGIRLKSETNPKDAGMGVTHIYWA